MNILSVENMRKSDENTQHHGISGRELMKRAGQGIVGFGDFLREKTTFGFFTWKPPVAILCGKGNNAGDGYVIAKTLQEQRIPCTLFLLSDVFSVDGQYYYDQCVEMRVPVETLTEETELGSYQTIVDCIFGTGFQGKVQGIFRTAIEKINGCQKKGIFVLSVDINSGLNGNSGMAEIDEQTKEPLCVHSNLTISIGNYQPGHYLNMAKDVMDELKWLDIGIEPCDNHMSLFTLQEAKRVLPKRKNFSNKSTYGYVGLLGGSGYYHGAVKLATLSAEQIHMATLSAAAMRSGAGVVMTAVPKDMVDAVAPMLLEATLFPLNCVDSHVVFCQEEIDQLMARTKVIAFGMGVGLAEETGEVLRYLIQHYTKTLLIDADGLTLLSRMDGDILNQKKCQIVLTPHNMEFSRISGNSIDEILHRPIEIAEEYAKKWRVVLLLKGPTTIVTDGDRTYLVNRGCAGMATAGSGDVLSGILAATCGYVPGLLEATALAAYVNGAAGELAQGRMGTTSMIAGDTVKEIPDVMKNIEKS